MTEKIYNFLRDTQPATPCLVVDLDVVRARYDALTEALPLAAVHYAVKANPAPEVISVLKDKLGLVTAGLGVAFDTTLLALVMSVLVMFPTSMLQTKEEALLTAIDDYTNENFLKRLDEEKEGGKMDKEDAGVQLELLASLVEQQEQILTSHREQIDLLRLLVSQQRNR